MGGPSHLPRTERLAPGTRLEGGSGGELERSVRGPGLRASRPGARRWLRAGSLLHRLLLLLVVLISPRLAWAEPVPMCGELAQSIEAPPPIYPGREATLGQAHCARQAPATTWEEDASLPPQVDETRTTKIPLGYFVPTPLPQVSQTRLPVPDPETFELPRGVRREVDRPPRVGLLALL